MEVPNDFGTTTEAQLRSRLAAVERERDEALARVKTYKEEREKCPHCRERNELRARIAALEEGIREMMPDVDREMVKDFSPWPGFFCYEYACKRAYDRFRSMVEDRLAALLAEKGEHEDYHD